MIRLFFPVVLFVFMTAAGAQETASEEKPVVEEESAAADEIDDFVLDIDEDHTREDEDVFIPSDKVSFEQSVSFPTDI